MLGDGTKEWKLNFDPVATEKMNKIYGTPMPDSFLPRHWELEAWRRIMERRAEFDLDEMQPDLGQPILDIIHNTMRGYRADYIAEKKKRAEEKDRAELAGVLLDLSRNYCL